jgi:hypothetical protein
MRHHRIAVALGAFAMIAVAGAAWANDRLRVPQDAQPPFYLGGGGPSVLTNGSIFVMHDGEYAAIPFWRPPESMPAGFDLLNDFDPNVLNTPLLVEGHVIFKDGVVHSWESRGTGAVPVWFVRLSELQTAMADGDLPIEELAALDSLIIGIADFYHEQNHAESNHPVSHLTVVASGTLDDGRAFHLHVVEVGLELKQVQIVFD